MASARRLLAQIVQLGGCRGYEQPTYALRSPQAHLRTDLNDLVESAMERKYLSIVNEDTA